MVISDVIFGGCRSRVVGGETSGGGINVFRATQQLSISRTVKRSGCEVSVALFESGPATSKPAGVHLRKVRWRFVGYPPRLQRPAFQWVPRTIRVEDKRVRFQVVYLRLLVTNERRIRSETCGRALSIATTLTAGPIIVSSGVEVGSRCLKAAVEDPCNTLGPCASAKLSAPARLFEYRILVGQNYRRENLEVQPKEHGVVMTRQR